MVHLRCDEPVRIQVLSQNQAGRSNEMTRPTLIYDVGMDSGHSIKLQHQVKWALNCHSLQFEGMTALASYLEVSRRTMDGGLSGHVPLTIERPTHKQLLVMHRTNLRYLVLLGLRCTDRATQPSHCC